MNCDSDTHASDRCPRGCDASAPTPAEQRANERRPTAEALRVCDDEYHRRFQALAREHGGPYKIPRDIMADLRAWHAEEVRKAYGWDNNFKPLKGDAKPKKEYVSPETRMRRELGAECKNGHDLTATLPNGKGAIYIDPKGKQACRWCKQDAAARHKAKKEQQAA